ncbi:hypothetical protein BJY01DRAFT_255239 [Aspergillus pseudoustus]|uniref:Extracellular serine-rich protein n=1 Tax=Aspergillus pseudoustus TaxID=1810923 RepID=A0ABR4IM24_9EURO
MGINISSLVPPIELPPLTSISSISLSTNTAPVTTIFPATVTSYSSSTTFATTFTTNVIVSSSSYTSTTPATNAILSSSSYTSTTIATNAIVNSSKTAKPLPSATPSSSESLGFAADILIIARNSAEANVASSGLNAYGIPFTTLLVPQSGAQLPILDSAAGGGRFGGIVIAGEVSYDYSSTNGSWASALTPSQWNQLYAYQLKYGVRMVEYDVSPGIKFGTKLASTDGCCEDNIEQLISFSDTSDFPSAGLRTGAGVSTKGLWHYPASIVNSTNTKAIAVFAGNQVIAKETTAAVINNFNGRQQMAFFIAFDTTWSPTSVYLQHAWITWITRGLYAGYRRVNLNTQVDDMFLSTAIYKSNRTFRITPTDLDGITSWLPVIRSRLNPGSTYFIEVGHNGNGNVGAATEEIGPDSCSGGAIVLTDPASTPLEFKKPLGTGANIWPETPSSFSWSTKLCLEYDELLRWWQKNYNEYAHVSHTFTHLRQDNVTYSDASKEITFNQAWLSQVGLSSSASLFTSNGIIPGAITGLHNGDALQAWRDNGITNCVGDNSRPVLRNQQNPMWPYFTSLSADGFDGMQVNPRWPTRIYFDCDSPGCSLQQWIDRFAGSGDFNNLLAAERDTTLVQLLGLYHDSYMFHQANLRNAGAGTLTVGGATGRYSAFQAWVEIVVQELVRLVTWPIVSTTHQQMSENFLQRYKRDQCGYALAYEVSGDHITGVTVTARANNQCSAKIPITVPVDLANNANTHNFTTEKLGSDPLTVWVQLSGDPVSLALASPIPL